ncbi:MAG TPA: NAD(P)-dependent oxidoreductase [Kiloniellaceae bacterium]|nr:NAD(P)-dependent oxidoreductase [Kiloniellaceae bacterium]
MQTIGLIGAGLMGRGIGKNLLAKGKSLVTLAHRDRSGVEQLLARGATEATSPRDVAAKSDAVIVCVTAAPQLERVVFGEEGLLSGLRAGHLVIDCTTGEPELTDRLAADLAARGIDFVDAPLARTPVEAEAGRLNAMVGGTPEAFRRAEPILALFCENIFPMGPAGSGARMKLINNLITMGQAVLIAEALVACRKTGVDPERFRAVISAGGGNSGIFQMLVPALLEEGSCEGMGFSLANAEKDLRYLLRMLGSAGQAAPVGAAVHAAFLQAKNAGYGDGLVGHLIAAQADLNGVPQDFKAAAATAETGSRPQKAAGS